MLRFYIRAFIFIWEYLIVRIDRNIDVKANAKPRTKPKRRSAIVVAPKSIHVAFCTHQDPSMMLSPHRRRSPIPICMPQQTNATHAIALQSRPQPPLHHTPGPRPMRLRRLVHLRLPPRAGLGKLADPAFIRLLDRHALRLSVPFPPAHLIRDVRL